LLTSTALSLLGWGVVLQGRTVECARLRRSHSTRTGHPGSARSPSAAADWTSGNPSWHDLPSLTCRTPASCLRSVHPWFHYHKSDPRSCTWSEARCSPCADNNYPVLRTKGSRFFHSTCVFPKRPQVLPAAKKARCSLCAYNQLFHAHLPAVYKRTEILLVVFDLSTPK
jgi:hypothetical protein